MDDYVDDANIFHPSPFHLYLPIINIEDIDAHPKDSPKNYLLGFISNSFILFWSIYYSSYANNKQKSRIMFKKNNSPKIGDWVITTKNHKCLRGTMLKGSKVQIIDIDVPRGYSIQDEEGNCVVEIGWTI